MVDFKNANELLLADLDQHLQELSKKRNEDEYLLVEINNIFVTNYDFRNPNLPKFYGRDTQNVDKLASVLCAPSQINLRVTNINKEDLRSTEISFKVSE